MTPDDSRIDLRGGETVRDPGEPEFRINRGEEASHEFVGGVSAVPVSELEEVAMKPHNKVKVKFDKFVNLIASHAYEDVFEKHVDEDIILSTDLLADLANAHEDKKDRKVPAIFLFGILLGIAVTWILLKF